MLKSIRGTQKSMRRGTGGGRRVSGSCSGRLLQQCDFGLDVCPGLGVVLCRIRRIRVAVEAEKFGAQIRADAAELVLRKSVQKLGVRLVVQAVFARVRFVANIKIRVGESELSGSLLPQQPLVLRDGGVETAFKELFGLWRGSLELQNAERPEFRNKPVKKREEFIRSRGLAVVFSPFLFVMRLG